MSSARHSAPGPAAPGPSSHGPAAHDGATADGARRPGAPERPAPRDDGAVTRGGKTASIARSIARSIWLRRLLGFAVLDVLVAGALLGSFVMQCHVALSSADAGAATAGVRFVMMDGQVPVRAVAGDGAGPAVFETVDAPALAPDGSRARLLLLAYEVTLDSGETHVFPLAQMLSYGVPVLAVMLACELVALVAASCSTRLIRRKLRPLNELALTAEAIGSVDDDQLDSQLDSLQRAIASADVNSPQVSTGDEDLRSIEVALNGLLRRMQEAKLQQMRFVDDVSHELRTPIAVIDGYVTMLDRWGKTDPAVLDESIEALKGESAHMRELVEQLLFLARGDAGRTRLSREPLDLAQVVREVWEESRMIDRDHAYVLDLPRGGAGEAGAENAVGGAGVTGGDGCLTMVGDLALVKQSMRIMVQNAAKYSAAGTTIRLGARRSDGGRAASGAGEVAYVVQDEGIGMSAVDERHAFERFWRSDEARGGAAEGSGLGLSIAKWIVDAHDGRVDVLSAEGVGTRFTVWFPASSGTQPADVQQAALDPQARPARPTGR